MQAVLASKLEEVVANGGSVRSSKRFPAISNDGVLVSNRWFS